MYKGGVASFPYMYISETKQNSGERSRSTWPSCFFILVFVSIVPETAKSLLVLMMTAIPCFAIYMYIQSNLDYSKCQGPQKSFRIIGSSNDLNREFSDIFGKTWMLS